MALTMGVQQGMGIDIRWNGRPVFVVEWCGKDTGLYVRIGRRSRMMFNADMRSLDREAGRRGFWEVD